eukprot:768438-Hanusia_phi.AAC.3
MEVPVQVETFIGGHHDGGSDVLARGRFVKVAMQGEGQLGLREVQLYGEETRSEEAEGVRRKHRDRYD